MQLKTMKNVQFKLKKLESSGKVKEKDLIRPRIFGNSDFFITDLALEDYLLKQSKD